MSARKISNCSIKQWLLRSFHTSRHLLEATVIDGKNIADQVLEEVRCEVEMWTSTGKRSPKLIAILVGNNPASELYVNKKMKAAKNVGINCETICFPSNVTRKKLFGTIQKLNNDFSVDGFLIQLPLPEHINEQEICQTISLSKDVDGFHSENIGRLALNQRGIVPATALGVKELIVRLKIPTCGKNAVVIGRSKHVGFPIALLLHSNGIYNGLDMTTTICHRHTPKLELERHVKLSDFVISCAGVPGLVNKEMIKPGACVIDVGISRIKTESGRHRLVGDVDYEPVKKIAGYITPVPGGVGPMTVAMLMKNTVFAAKLKKLSKT